MRVFVSYSGRDNPAVAALYTDLERSRHTVWLDHEIRGGETWWQAIIAEIRRCEVFVLAVSELSMMSQACLAELDYARRLGKPVLPVLVEDVSSMRTLAVADTQVVDYRSRTADTAIALMSAVTDAAARGRPMPRPLPPEPPMPYAYLLRLAKIVDGPQLAPTQQVGLLAELRHTWQNEREEIIRREIVDLVVRLRNRPDTTYGVGSEIDSVLATISGDRPQTARQFVSPPAARPTAPATGRGQVSTQQPPSRGPVPWRVTTLLGLSVLLVGSALAMLAAGLVTTGVMAVILFIGPLVGAVGTVTRRLWGPRVTTVALVVLLAADVVFMLIGLFGGASGAIAAAVFAVFGLVIGWMLLMARHPSVRGHVAGR